MGDSIALQRAQKRANALDRRRDARDKRVPISWLSLILVTLSLQVQAATMGELLDAAWKRSAEAGALMAQAPLLQAQRNDARRWFPATPTISVSHVSDQWHADEGVRDWESELETPLWNAGQRHAQRQSVDARESLLNAQEQWLRWSLAGELRELSWQLLKREAQFKAAQARVDMAEAMERDVLRRVAAGELAQTDALLVQSETLEARNARDDADLRMKDAQRNFWLLSGQESLPDPMHETPPAESEPDAMLRQHPRVRLAVQTQAAANADVNVARKSAEPLSAALLLARNRDALDASESRTSESQTIGVRITIPVGADARQRSVVAAAQAERFGANARLEAVQREVARDMAYSRAQWHAARQQSLRAKQQYAATGQALLLSRRAFDAGELDLASLLRVQQAENETQEQSALKEIAYGRAIAKLNQAWGILP